MGATPSGFAIWSLPSIRNAEQELPTGILGGTFDPVHRGHLAAAEQLRDRVPLREVWLLPNADPPHRQRPRVSGKDRLAMVRLAVVGRGGLHASDLEVARGGTSYTVQTLDMLDREYPGRSFVWLLGFDAALGIREWRDPPAVLARIRFVIFNRPGAPAPEWARLAALGFPDRTRVVRIDPLPVAAHDVRERVRRGLPVGEMVPAPVEEYIRAHGLYRDSGPEPAGRMA